MRTSSSWRRNAAAIAVVALVAAACGNGDDGGDGGDAGSADAGSGGIATDFGVTDEPCPEGINPDNGCIYLGHISDLTEGPFAPLAVEILEAQENFFERINEDGGIGGYDISLVVRDNRYNNQEHVTAYEEIADDILALAMSLGTPTTLAALSQMDDEDMLAIPASWWSGWDHEEEDRGLVLSTGYSYCIESMIALDWYSQEFGTPSTVLAVGYPGDYGGDSAAGAREWADANGVEFLGFQQTAPNIVLGNQDGAVNAILQADPDVVMLGVGPTENGEIVAKTVARGFEGFFMGALPTWNPALLATEARDPLIAQYRQLTFVETWDGTSEAHEAMRASLGGELPANDGYLVGWFMSYPMVSLLETAIANGDLTRAGLRAASDGLEVSYEGAIPDKTFTGDGAVDALRTAVINIPDPDSSLGLSTLVADFESPTANAFDYSRACSDG